VSAEPFSTQAVAVCVISIEKKGQEENGRKIWGETFLPLLVGIDID
jgi:hypothetical protein